MYHYWKDRDYIERIIWIISNLNTRLIKNFNISYNQRLWCGIEERKGFYIQTNKRNIYIRKNGEGYKKARKFAISYYLYITKDLICIRKEFFS